MYAVDQKLKVFKNVWRHADGVLRGPLRALAARLRIRPPLPCSALPLTHGHGEWDENEMRTVMEELSAVGEQVFDAECILNKRLRKVTNIHTDTHIHRAWIVILNACLISTGKTGVSGQVEGMVVQVSENWYTYYLYYVCVSIYVEYIGYLYIIWTSTLPMQRYFTHGASKHPWMWIARKGERERNNENNNNSVLRVSFHVHAWIRALLSTWSHCIAFASFCCISLCLPSYFFSTVSFHQVVLLFCCSLCPNAVAVDRTKHICMHCF